MNIIALPIIGFLIGLLIISLGGGGGGFYVGILTAFFNIPPAIAAATSLATIIPTTSIGTYSHYKAGNVNIRLGLIMMSGAIVGAIVGALFSKSLPLSFYNKITGLLLIFLGIQMFISYIQKHINKEVSHSSEIDNRTQKMIIIIKAISYGFLGGVMSGLVGISGTTPIIAGLTVLGCSAIETVGTSVFVLVGISVTGFIMHLGLGNVDWKLVGLLVLGTTAGAFLAPIVLKKFKREDLEKFLPPILIIMVIVMGSIVFIK